MTELPIQDHSDVSGMSPAAGDALKANLKKGPRPKQAADEALILRGWQRDKESGEYVTNLALYKKASEDHMTGYAILEGQKVNVIAHINARMNDPEKPNFLVLRPRVRPDDPAAHDTLAYGNAINSRRDQKPVYFDEVLFQFKNGTVLGARLQKDVPAELQQRLGFKKPVLPRPSKDSPSATPAAELQSKPDPAAVTAGDDISETKAKAKAKKQKPAAGAGPAPKIAM